MDVRAELIKGLTSDPKHLPVWYRYDHQGSLYNDRCLTENQYYYFYKSEVSAITNSIQKMVDSVPVPCTLVEMGSGNSEKSRMFIDAMLTKQSILTYVPVDISADFLRETSEALAADYGDKLDVRPVAGDYSVGIEALKDIRGNKLIIWLGGGFQNQPYQLQVQRLDQLSSNMADADRLIVALDVTQDATSVENAYLDPTGISAPLYLNAVWRLNREYNSNIDTEKFELAATFVKTADPDVLSKVLIRARSKCNQTYEISGLGINLTFKEGEYLCFYEGEGTSCKYTQTQIQTLAKKGNQVLDEIWIDDDNHVALCSFKKN